MTHPSKLTVLFAACALMMVGAFGFSVLTSTAHAGNARRNDLTEYMRQLNGSPRKLGVISGGAATAQDQTNTSVPFTIPRGETIFIACDVDAFCIENTTTVTSSYTSSAQGFPIPGSKPYPVIMRGGSGNVDKLGCIATAAWNCSVFSMD